MSAFNRFIAKMGLPRGQVLIKVFFTLLIFVLVKDFHEISNINQLIIALLEFIIVLEIVRMIFEFIMDDEHRIKLRLMIDSTIIFFVRDIMLIVNEKFDEKKIFFILGIIAILFVFRVAALHYTPSRYEKGVTE